MRLTSKPEKREVTVAFAGGALVLLLAGGAFSLGGSAGCPRSQKPSRASGSTSSRSS